MSSPNDSVPLVSLKEGVEIPQLGFGVFQVPPEDTVDVVRQALTTGYRHIDTAAAYQNEVEVGEAVRGSGLDRSEVFITTKCANDDHGHDEATRALHASLERHPLESRVHVRKHAVHVAPVQSGEDLQDDACFPRLGHWSDYRP